MLLKAHSLTEKQLMQGCVDRDPKCQKGVFDRYGSKMLAVVRRYARHEMEAEDMLQDGFVKVFKYIDTFGNRGSFEGWIRRIMINTALKHCSKVAFKKESIGVEKLPENSTDPAIFSKLGIDELMKLVQDLPDGYRIVFNLYAVEGYNHKEIADLLNIGESTSRSQLVKARRILQQRVEELAKIAV